MKNVVNFGLAQIVPAVPVLGPLSGGCMLSDHMKQFCIILLKKNLMRATFGFTKYRTSLACQAAC